jgi:hypothetical protein
MKRTEKDESSSVIRMSEPEQKVEPQIEPEEPKLEPKEEYLLLLEGFLPKIKETLEQLPLGDIPYKVVFEAADRKAFGKQTFLMFIKKDSSYKAKLTLVDEIGITRFKGKIEPMLKNYTVLDILNGPIEKTTGRKEYLAILIKK